VNLIRASARGQYDLKMKSWGCSDYTMLILERLSFGQYRWPIRADNDRDHLPW
jgi:hypothetical protein